MKLYNKINNLKIVNKKNVMILSIIVFVVCLLPLIMISFYNFPAADDFNSSIFAYQGYLKDGILGVLKGAIDNTVASYTTWQGTYSTAFISPLNPFVINEKYYVLTSLFLLGMFIYSVYKLVKYVFYEKLKLDKNSLIILIVILLLLCIQFVPSLVEGFYWWNGAVLYTFFFSMQLLFIYNLLKQLDSPKKSRMVKIIFLSLLIAGGNFVTILNNLIILALLLIYLIYKKDERYKMVLVIFITFLLGFLINVLAPGNSVRASSINNKMNPIVAIITSFFAATKKIGAWTNVTMIICLMFALYLVYPTVEKIKFKFKNPILFTLIAFCVFSALFTPPLYAMSSIGPLRVHNVVYYYLVLYLFIVMYYWLGYIKNNIIDKKIEQKIRSITVKHKATLLFTLIFVVGINVVANYESLSSYKALKPLINGEAKVYREQMLERFRIYHDENIMDMEIEELKYKPEAIFFDDIEDVDNWKNASIVSYYGKKSLKFKNK